MQENEHEWQSNQDGTQKDDEPEQLQVPATLLPNVLQRLGLSPEQTPSEQSIDDLLLKLRSGTWEERALALRALGRLEHPVSLNLLAPFLQDEDETVRATTIDVLGTMSKQVPLHWLVEALHDTNWHVREASVFALAKQGARVPKEVLMTALHDRDGSVREAASFVLRQNSAAETSSALYGQLREETAMQRELYDPARLNGKHADHAPVNTQDGDWNGAFMEYGNGSTRTHAVNEQAQAYAAGHYAPHRTTSQEVAPDEYAEIQSSRNEKVTSYRLRGKAQKSWWTITIVVVAILFLGLGRLSTMIVPQSSFGVGSKTATSGVPIPVTTAAQPAQPFLLNDYSPIMEASLSNVLHLVPGEIQSQLKLRGSLEAVATAQGVSASDLYTAEMNAFHLIFNQATKEGSIDPQSASVWMDQLKSDSGLRDKTVLSMLSTS